MLQTAWHLARGWQDKCIRARGIGPHQTVVGISHPRVLRDLGKVAAYQRKIMRLIHTTNTPDTLHRLLVADMTTERIARVRGIRDNSPGAHDIHRTLDQARLRIYRMNLKVLGHKYFLEPLIEVAQGCADYGAKDANADKRRLKNQEFKNSPVYLRSSAVSKHFLY